MADLNLSQEEIDALLGGVESIVNVAKEDGESPAPADAAPAPAANEPPAPPAAAAPAAVAVLDELSRDFGQELMSACIGNAHEAFADILNATVEFQHLGYEEHTPETLRAKFAPDPAAAVDGEIEKPLPGQMLFLARRGDALLLGDLLMGNDGSAPSADMEKIYVQAIGEALKRFAASAITPKIGDLLSHPFTLEFKNPRSVLTSGPTDFGLRNPVLLGSWKVTAQLAPDRAVAFDWHFALDANFLTQANPINIEKYAARPATAQPTQPPAQPSPQTAAAAGIPSLDQNEIDALLSRVQQSVAAPAPAQAQPQMPGFAPAPAQAQPQMPGFAPQPVPEPAYAMHGAGSPAAAAAGHAPPPGPYPPQMPPHHGGMPAGYGPAAPYGQTGSPIMSMQQPPYDPNQPGGVPPQGQYYGQPWQGAPGMPPQPQPASFQPFGHPPMGGAPQAQPVHFAPLTYSPAQGIPSNIELLLDVPLQITVELGRTKKQIQEILELTEGSIVELDKIAGESIDLLVNNKLIAKGEVVVIDENFGIRITSIVSPSERLANMK